MEGLSKPESHIGKVNVVVMCFADVCCGFDGW